MNKKAYIWDLDGTLLDSYDIIVRSLQETFREVGINLDYKMVHNYVIRYSVSNFIKYMEAETGLNFNDLQASYKLISAGYKFDIKLMPNANEILRDLTYSGARHFVYTHRGATTRAVLDNLGITSYFDEIITSLNMFPRKPAQNAIEYLCRQYSLDKNNTFYVGDRSIDMECAKNAGIKGILYLVPNGVGESTGVEDYIVSDLMQIKNL